MPESKSGALPLGYAPIISDSLARTLALLPGFASERGNFDVALADLAGARAYSRSERAVEFGDSVFLHHRREVATQIQPGRAGRNRRAVPCDLRMKSAVGGL